MPVLLASAARTLPKSGHTAMLLIPSVAMVAILQLMKDMVLNMAVRLIASLNQRYVAWQDEAVRERC